MTADKLHDDEIRALDRPAAAGREQLVPASYAEKAMSSLLRLHEDLVEEKEKRIDLYRRLMEREQSLAEFRAYVKLLEGELARRGFDPTQYAIDPVQAPAPGQVARVAAAAAAQQAQQPAAAAAPAVPAASAAAAAPAAPAASAAAAAPTPSAAAAAAAANAATGTPTPAAPAGAPPVAPVIAWTPNR